jgi:hypothetical protein
MTQDNAIERATMCEGYHNRGTAAEGHHDATRVFV